MLEIRQKEEEGQRGNATQKVRFVKCCEIQSRSKALTTPLSSWPCSSWCPEVVALTIWDSYDSCGSVSQVKLVKHRRIPTRRCQFVCTSPMLLMMCGSYMLLCAFMPCMRHWHNPLPRNAMRIWCICFMWVLIDVAFAQACWGRWWLVTRNAKWSVGPSRWEARHEHDNRCSIVQQYMKQHVMHETMHETVWHDTARLFSGSETAHGPCR